MLRAEQPSCTWGSWLTYLLVNVDGGPKGGDAFRVLSNGEEDWHITRRAAPVGIAIGEGDRSVQLNALLLDPVPQWHVACATTADRLDIVQGKLAILAVPVLDQLNLAVTVDND